MCLRPMAVAATALLFAPALAGAAEPPEQEYRAIARCSVATSVFEVIVTESRWAGATAADKSLVARAAAADRGLRERSAALVATIGKETASTIFDEETAAAGARLEGPEETRDVTARAALDHYAPELETCIVRAGELLG
jgi:hypothetical protein